MIDVVEPSEQPDPRHCRDGVSLPLRCSRRQPSDDAPPDAKVADRSAHAPTLRVHEKTVGAKPPVRLRIHHLADAARVIGRTLTAALCGVGIAACSAPGPKEPEQSEFNPAHYGIPYPKPDRPPHKWTKFVSVRGQPEPVPAEWVETPEGRFAHDIVIPNPVPKDSGYKPTMSATEYFLHLCEREAGLFVYRTVKDVPGFLFMRVPTGIGRYEMEDKYWLEAPPIQRRYEGRLSISYRGLHFAGGHPLSYSYFEEPLLEGDPINEARFVVAFDPAPRSATLRQSLVRTTVTSRYGVTWRGLLRRNDREAGIAGSELIVLDIKTNEVLGVLRSFVISRNGYWLTAAGCPQQVDSEGRFDEGNFHRYIATVIRPPEFRREGLIP